MYLELSTSHIDLPVYFLTKLGGPNWSDCIWMTGTLYIFHECNAVYLQYFFFLKKVENNAFANVQHFSSSISLMFI